ncbi:glycoside hydrolase family 2 TIM barrel-domain containing protein [Streptococcus sp. S784/96/1]|uniref:glycoside hydrolase family 2 TIM barrel-domain containing protein n=1 Tax=Streptococcus sp. S784/96/1 TaxID=2653499 RepID=UPI001389A323|nr:glycoside hydrolase family 2 TIM barrel-domain containing protein [Streptococcus sp. S784/96/1]
MKQELYNDNWLFWNDGDSFALVWNVPEKAKSVTLPHDAMLEEKPYAESNNGGNTGFRDGGNYVYVKTFKATEADLEQRLVLKFEGSYMNTFVYVNGQLAGKHHNGYTTFYVPIHDFLQVGDNEIRVQVRNGAMSNSRWYSGSGIYRDVYLLRSQELHVAASGSRVETMDVSDDLATVKMTVPLVNESSRARTFNLVLRIKDDQGQLVQQDSRPYFIKAGESSDLVTSLVIEKAQLWSADSPYRYQLEVDVTENDQLIDCDKQTFGIRTITVDSKRGLRINGKTVKLRGACIHHDSGLLGAATYLTAEKRRVRLLKEAGFNAIRMAHHPAAPALLEACDELGLYVMDETFDMWTRFKGDFDYSLVFEENWRKDVSAMVLTDFNHPSVILYSIGNEIPEIATKHGAHLAKDIHDHIKSLDSTRPTLAGINGVFASSDGIPQILRDVVAEKEAKGEEVVGNVNDFMSMMDTSMDQIVVHPIVSENLERATAATDIAGYNYMTARYALDAVNYPNRVMVGSETYPPEIARNWEVIQQLPSVIGDFTWTGWDYIGEAGVGVPAYNWGEGGFGAQFPCQLAYCGDIDITGERRPLSYYREIVFGLRKEPYIAVQKPEHYGKKLIKTPWVLSDAVHSWTWSGHEGQPIVVEVYAAGDEVALYLNDELLAKQSVGQDLGCLTTFETIYQAGELKAVNYLNGEIIAEHVLGTADESSAHLVAEVEENADLTYVRFSVVDASGMVIPSVEQDLHIELEGAKLLGFGTGNPKPEEHYLESNTTTYYGQALAILQKTEDLAKMTVSGENLNLDVNI